jgi:hypothetical protein
MLRRIPIQSQNLRKITLVSRIREDHKQWRQIRSEANKSDQAEGGVIYLTRHRILLC